MHMKPQVIQTNFRHINRLLSHLPMQMHVQRLNHSPLAALCALAYLVKLFALELEAVFMSFGYVDELNVPHVVIFKTLVAFFSPFRPTLHRVRIAFLMDAAGCALTAIIFGAFYVVLRGKAVQRPSMLFERSPFVNPLNYLMAVVIALNVGSTILLTHPHTTAVMNFFWVIPLSAYGYLYIEASRKDRLQIALPGERRSAWTIVSWNSDLPNTYHMSQTSV